MIPLRQALLAASLLGSAVLGWMGHNGLVYQPHLKKDAQMGARAEVAARKIEQAGTKIATEARDLNDNQQAAIRVVTVETVKAIPYYVPLPSKAPAGRGEVDSAGGSPAGYPLLSVGFGRLHDYAALGIDPPVPAPSGESLSAPSGIDLPGLAHTLTTNYGLCHADWAEVEAWRGWYRKEAEAWGSK